MGGRKEEKEEVQGVIRNWSELCPDLLRCVCNRLSFAELSRAKSVCSSWHSGSKGCVPKPNQIPWLILFPRKEETNSSSCVLFVPEDKEKVYKTRDLGVDFVQSRCLATYGSWLLMVDRLYNKLYILNPLTRERIDLPYTKSLDYNSTKVCFRIDNITKEYLVVLRTIERTMFTKKGVNKWDELIRFRSWFNGIAYNHKNQKLYVYSPGDPLMIWDFSGDKPRKDGFLENFRLNHYDPLEGERHLVVTVSGDVLIVSCGRVHGYKAWRFGIYKANHVNREWVRIDYLGDEALILDMGTTVLAKDIPGIKRNSIYFSGMDDCINNHGKDDPKHIFVFDLTTQKIEELPQCVLSIQFSDARWFFPGYSG